MVGGLVIHSDSDQCGTSESAEFWESRGDEILELTYGSARGDIETRSVAPGEFLEKGPELYVDDHGEVEMGMGRATGY